jgi:hypothetical protein
VVQLFAEEGIRSTEVPGIVFRDGSAGRRPGVAGSLDVWEVVEVANSLATMDAAVVAAELSLPTYTVQIALDYYSRFPGEIDQWIADGEVEAERARAAWQRRRIVPV